MGRVRTVDVSRTVAELSLAANASVEQAKKAAQAGINRTLDRVRTEAVRKTTETYAIKPTQLRPHVRVSKVGTRVGGGGTLKLQVRAVPVEAFPVRVVMEDVRLVSRSGKPFIRRLPGIELQRFVDGRFKRVGGAFPLRQRRAGKLRRGEKVRRRIGKERGKLTKLRYFTFPKGFIEDVLAPHVIAFAAPRFEIEFRAALRAFTKRRGRVLRRNN